MGKIIKSKKRDKIIIARSDKGIITIATNFIGLIRTHPLFPINA